MHDQKLNRLVGKSFEDLSVEEMQELQGAGGVEVNSTPTIIIPISTIELSEAISVLLSLTTASVISVVATKQNKCS
jgi:type 2 lantibiotic (TIGR03893 family)